MHLSSSSTTTLFTHFMFSHFSKTLSPSCEARMLLHQCRIRGQRPPDYLMRAESQRWALMNFEARSRCAQVKNNAEPCSAIATRTPKALCTRIFMAVAILSYISCCEAAIATSLAKLTARNVLFLTPPCVSLDLFDAYLRSLRYHVISLVFFRANLYLLLTYESPSCLPTSHRWGFQFPPTKPEKSATIAITSL